MITTLEKLGLSEKEAKVYLAALELGASSVQNIARKAGVNRATTYVILESLAKKGLASSYDKGKKTYFTAETPEQLSRLIKKKEEEIEEKREELNKLIPELKAIYNISGSKPKVKFYEGSEGNQAMLQDALRSSKPGDEVFSFTPFDLFKEAHPQYKDRQVSDRVKKKVKIKIIYTREEGIITGANSKIELRTARFIPKNLFPLESVISIGPSKIVRIYSYKNGFSGVTIEDEQVFITLKSIFNLAWQAAEKYN